MSNICQEIHVRLNNMQRYAFPFDLKDIPLNGIYILFEKGEKSHNADRIVRVGTHRGDNNLPKRLKEHFINENKDRSIFRKNIGRTFLNRDSDDYLKVWNLDLIGKHTAKYNDLIDKVDISYQKQIEKKVSDYIQKSFSFCIIEVENKEKRLEYETKLIGTISLCNECKASSNWLGLYSPEKQIRESSLWLKQGLYKGPLSMDELIKLGL